MKRIVFIAALFISTVSFSQYTYQANNDQRLPKQEASFSFNVLPEDGSFVLSLDNPQQKKLQVWVRHSVYGTISDTVIYKDKLYCRYNLDHLDDGVYIITVSNGKEKLVKEIQMTTTTTVRRNVAVR
jgi:hypothetical protein